MVQKIEFDFTHSVNLGPIIVNILIKNKNKIDVPVVTELGTSCLPSQHFKQASNNLVYHYLIFVFALFANFQNL